MGDGAPYAWLTREVWAETWSRAYRYARKLKHPHHEAEEFAEAAMAAALDPERSAGAWVPFGPVSFASHVCKLVRSAHGNHVQSYAVLHASVPLTEEALAGQVEARTPDLILEEKAGAELARARYDLLLERTEKDALVSLLLEDGEGETSTERATGYGHTLDEIEAARKRLKRHIDAVVKQLPAPDAAAKDTRGKAR